jgi:type II secretory pathway pseudopilin PulG
MKSVKKNKRLATIDARTDGRNAGESGFSLVEAIVAMLILLIALLGVFMTFTYAINFNAGNYARSQALVVLQREVELMRSGKFTPGVTDQGPYPDKPDLRGGVQSPRSVQTADGNRFSVNITVDDNPATTAVDVNPNSTLKHITIVVSSEAPTPGWQSAIPATVVMRRVRSN